MAEQPNSTALQVVSLNDIQNLLTYFSKNTYVPNNSHAIATEAENRSIALMQADYKTVLIHNSTGELSGYYPSQIIVLENENIHSQNISNLQTNSNSQPSSQRTTNTIYENLYDANKLRDLIQKARFARCRARFPVPVILYKGKHICRSSTLSGGPEIYGRSGFDYIFYGRDTGEKSQTDEENEIIVTQSDWQLFDRVRSFDIKLLKTFNVETIVDFMVEKKKVKFGMNVTSSEKVDKENRYANFKIISLPYPGCEFFKDFRDNNYLAEGLVFDWSQGHVDANINVPDDAISAQLHINWETYKSWDLIEITQNYMKLLLKHLQENSTGLLIHCISGWDRTPLFVSLLRISLWADGVAHQSLDAQQILYLTVAYDWMLFGHRLADRLVKGEEIFFFCFYMLKYLTSDEYSICVRHKSKYETRSDKSDKSERSVLRTDSDSQLEGIMLENDLRGSNISLNSLCSSVSSKSQDPPVWVQIHEETNGNEIITTVEGGTPLARSPVSRRTSPVTVPIASRLRQRQESSSSLSVGSWQMITGTGSLRGSDSNSDSNGVNGNSNSSSTSTLIDEDIAFFNMEGVNRKKRLMKLRELFYNSYSTAVGFRMANGEITTFGTILGTIVEKVGLSSKN